MIKKLIFSLLLIFSLVGSAFAANVSNADIVDEDMSDITDWTDGDLGTGESTQVTFDGQSTMKMYSGSEVGSGHRAVRTRDVGTFGARTVISIKLYCDLISELHYGDFKLTMWDGTVGLYLYFTANGLFIYNDAQGYPEIGTDLVVQDTWQEWTFDVDWTNRLVDVYLGGVLVASDVSCDYSEGGTNGTVRMSQAGTNDANRLTYVDYFKAGSDFAVTRKLIILIQ